MTSLSHNYSRPDREALRSQNEVSQKLASHFFWDENPASSHFVQFYETDDLLLDSLSAYIEQGLVAGEACIVVATRAHRESLEACLQTHNLCLEAAIVHDQYIALDAEETLAQFMVDGEPQPERVAEIINTIVTRAARGQRRVRAFGEMAPSLWAQGKQEAALHLEALWDDVARIVPPFMLLCAYPMQSFPREEDGAQLLKICQQHAHVLPDESYLKLADPDERLRTITLLQHKAHVLEAEIIERKAAEVRLHEQVLLSTLQMEISSALTAEATLRTSLGHCADLLIHALDAAVVRLWTLNEGEQTLELQIDAGRDTRLGEAPARVSVGISQVGLIAQERRPHLTNAVVGDPRISDQAWVRREGMVASAGYPLLVGERLVGVMTLFARHCLTEATLHTLAAIANTIALGIEHCWIQEERDALLAREREARAEAEREEARWHFLAESMPQKIFTAKSNGDVDYINPQWLEFTGLPFEQVKGWGWVPLVHPDDIGENLKRWRHALASGEPLYYEHRFRRADGVYRWHLSRAIPMRDPQGRVTMWIGSNTDITERKELERQKEILVSMATHELKTPLTALGGYTQLTARRLRHLQRLLPEEQAEQQKLLREALAMLDHAHQQLGLQTRLITDLLDASRLQEGAIDLRQIVCNLVQVVRERVQDCQTAHPHRQIALDLSTQRELAVQMDPDRIGQVLNNYLTNALKYAPVEKIVQVGITCEGTIVRVWVVDQGPGLSEEAQQHIWERFYRAPDIAVQNRIGVSLGLGLSICRGIIEGHGGHVGVESIPEQGSRFWFTLPLLARASPYK